MAEDYAVLWDADGVVFDSQDADGVFLWSKTIEADLGIAEAAFEPLWGLDFLEVIRGRIDMRAHVKKCFVEQAITVPVDDFIAYWLAKDTNLNEVVLRLVKNHHSYLATNQEALRTAHLENILAGAVKKIYGSGFIGAIKPEPEFFAFIERDLGLPPDRLYLVDDRPTNIEAARSRGWQAYHFTGLDSLPEFLRQ